jgi:hypothetical protein
LGAPIEIYNFLYEQILSRYGTPQILITDNATNLNGELIQSLCSEFNIVHKNSSAYHAACNGLIEKYNLSLKRCLQALPPDEKGHWHLYISAFCFSYNTIKQASTKMSPFFMLHGYHSRYPIQNTLQTIDQIDLDAIYPDTQLEEAVTKRFQHHLKSLTSVRKQAHHNIQQAQAKQRQMTQKRILQNKTETKPPFLIGDLVLHYKDVLDQDHSARIEDHFEGPYFVHQTFNNSTYLLKTQTGTILPKHIHGNKLKIYKKPLVSYDPQFFQPNSDDNAGFTRHTGPATGPSTNLKFRSYKPPLSQ